jgi:hypothetical protein
MTFPEVFELFDYWRQSPPTHELMARHVGYEPPKTMDAASAKLPSGGAGKPRSGRVVAGTIMMPR